VTYEQLRTFLAIARQGGVRRAAEYLNLSQPAVSGRLAALEAALDRPLFERTPQGLRPTRAGRELADMAEAALRAREAMLDRLAGPGAFAGTFRVGASETIAQSWLPAFARALGEAHPRVSLELTVDISRHLRAGLLDRRLDLALMMGPVSDPGVANAALPAFALAWLRRPGPGAVDLGAVPVISYARDTRPWREIGSEMAARHGAGARIHSSASLSAALRMIAEGLGVGPYPLRLAAPLIASGELATFDPGWHPEPLRFTASWLAEPEAALATRAARLAVAVAEADAAG
jgi:DNA-binding transcriptional LysR family regulator